MVSQSQSQVASLELHDELHRSDIDLRKELIAQTIKHMRLFNLPRAIVLSGFHEGGQPGRPYNDTKMHATVAFFDHSGRLFTDHVYRDDGDGSKESQKE